MIQRSGFSKRELKKFMREVNLAEATMGNTHPNISTGMSRAYSLAELITHPRSLGQAMQLWWSKPRSEDSTWAKSSWTEVAG